MKLENREYAYIPLAKLLDYLLSETHPVGKSKAKYLRSLGFNEINVNLLKEGLLAIARSEDVKEAISSSHGVKYVIDGTLQTPSGAFIRVRTIWVIDKDMERPRFVTAYPI
ncbi:MAG: hypothetical protein HY034_03975 [Nitrospirae bacterium]|nr:hypothetical protein [Nitrospirota bacterium]